MTSIDRRRFLSVALLLSAARCVQAERPIEAPSIGLAFGTYGMKQLSTLDALRCCAQIGYDGVELALMSGWPTEPALLSSPDRSQMRQQLVDFHLALPSLLENLPCVRSEEDHRTNLEKLKRATELAHDLSPDQPPVVQSIVGGKTEDWERDKSRLVEELSDWARVGESSETLVCFKPHADHLVHTPQRALWLHEQVGSSWLKTVYDYSHFFLAGIPLATSLTKMLPITPYVQVKDSRETPAGHEYLLPGDGSTDYLQLLKILSQSGYSGFVSVEVSSMVHRKPDYRPVETARLCYQRMAPLFEQARVRRPRRS